MIKTENKTTTQTTRDSLNISNVHYHHESRLSHHWGSKDKLVPDYNNPRDNTHIKDFFLNETKVVSTKGKREEEALKELRKTCNRNETCF